MKETNEPSESVELAAKLYCKKYGKKYPGYASMAFEAGYQYHQTHHSAEVERLKRLLAELADINSTSPYHQELRLRAFEALKEK